MEDSLKLFGWSH